MICFYHKMRHKWVRYEFSLFTVCFRSVVLFAVVLEIVTQGVRLCVTTPRATSRKTAPFYFTRIRQSRYFFTRFRFCKTLVCCLLCVEMQTLWQRWVWFLTQRFTEGLSKVELSSLSPSWFKPASALIWKYECWCEFEKDLKVFQYSFSETIPIFFIRLCANIVNVLHSKVATKFKLKCTGHGGMHDPH